MSSFLWHCVNYVISVTLCELKCHYFYDIVWIMSLFLWHCVNYVIISVTFMIMWVMSHFCDIVMWHCVNYVILSVTFCELCHHFYDIVWNVSFLWHCVQLPMQSVWVQTPLRRGVLDTALCDKVCQWLVEGRWFSLSTLFFSTNKTDCQDITEILLKVALNNITLTLFPK